MSSLASTGQSERKNIAGRSSRGGLIVEARETRQFNDQPPSESSNDLASLAQNSRTLEQKLSGQNTQKSGQNNQAAQREYANETNRGGQYESAQSGEYSQGQSTQAGEDARMSNQSGTSHDNADSNATLVPAEPSQPDNSESHKHDTTIHRTVKPAVIHETIRPVETNIITTNMTVHHHIHHYVHRIQPVIVSSDEEERWVHDSMGQGVQPSSEGTMYRQMGIQGELENEIGRQGQGVERGRHGYSRGVEKEVAQNSGDGEKVGHVGKHSGGGACAVCGSSGNVLKDTEGGKTHNGGICRVCGNDYDEELSRGISDMKISSGRSNELRNRV
jgi:hypothetical protein